ncbi:DrmB family protein [Streptomyces sp. NPDC056402]|uniref:DrmB family protein n=1 Tax=Streptomyces sp. NPDC056402 TaxID=3345810 RepID=UPI0035DB103B
MTITGDGTRSTSNLRVGELRPSQLLHTYGVGAVADLPNLSVMVLGLDEWELEKAAIVPEERLLAAVRSKVGAQVQNLRMPPYTPEDPNDFTGAWSRIGVPVAVFPGWLRCTDNRCNRLAPADSGLFHLLPNSVAPDQTRFVHSCRETGRKRPTAVPARFVSACPAGHVDDFPWMYFVHRGAPYGADHTLKLVERGTTGEAANIFVECSCEVKARSMAEAIGTRSEQVLPACRGRHPHLGTFEPCTEQTRTMALGATNGWFAMQLRVFSIPHADNPVDSAVAEHWAGLRVVAQLPRETARLVLPTQVMWPQLERFGPDEVLDAISRHQGENQADATEDTDALDIAGPEWLAFIGSPQSHPDFSVSNEPVPAAHRDWLGQVRLVKRLREVSALYGFSRIDAPEWGSATSGGEALEENRAPLSSSAPIWLPCAETRGEGIFLRFDEKRISAWEQDPNVIRRTRTLMKAHEKWCTQRRTAAEWPGIRYILLHTFSHVLIREFALECGYGASGIGERIYARSGADPMAGILLYTAAPDSEGTLGGLVSLGGQHRLGALIDQALEAARLCGSDPLCADHDPVAHGRLHGAACHACLFAAETSCERGNHFLDRELLVETFSGRPGGFFTA